MNIRREIILELQAKKGKIFKELNDLDRNDKYYERFNDKFNDIIRGIDIAENIVNDIFAKESGE